MSTMEYLQKDYFEGKTQKKRTFEGELEGLWVFKAPPFGEVMD